MGAGTYSRLTGFYRAVADVSQKIRTIRTSPAIDAELRQADAALDLVRLCLQNAVALAKDDLRKPVADAPRIEVEIPIEWQREEAVP